MYQIICFLMNKFLSLYWRARLPRYKYISYGIIRRTNLTIWFSSGHFMHINQIKQNHHVMEKGSL